jgi:hypothetical protein
MEWGTVMLLVAVGVIKTFYSLFFNAGEKEEKDG